MAGVVAATTSLLSGACDRGPFMSSEVYGAPPITRDAGGPPLSGQVYGGPPVPAADAGAPPLSGEVYGAPPAMPDGAARMAVYGAPHIRSDGGG
jgi:hypothetical protein